MGVGFARAATDAAIEFACSQQLGNKPLIAYQEVQLAKLELKQSAISGALGGAFFGVAGALGFFALMAITVAMARPMSPRWRWIPAMARAARRFVASIT